MATVNKQIHLVKRPTLEASEDCFKAVETPLPNPGVGEFLVKTQFVSVDPYLRGRMNDRKSYAQPQELNQTVVAGAVGEVIESHNPAFPVGAHVVGMFGWQQYAVSNGTAVRIVDTSVIPGSVYLGAVGMPGVTAWYGVNNILNPKPGQTVVISAASGAVGAVAGQLAKYKGAHVIGIAGGKAKCEYVVQELGFDACIDYKEHKDEPALIAALQAAAPQGVDAYFENVGGPVGDAVLQCMAAHGRIAVCGLIAQYDGQNSAITHPHLILTQRLLLQGFIVGEHMEVWPTALTELGALVASQKLKYRETVLEGLDAAPGGLLGLLHGTNFGKLVVRV